MIADRPACGHAVRPSIDSCGPVPWATAHGWLRLFVEPGQLTELRAIRHDKGIEAGFFTYEHLEDMARWGLDLSSSGRFKGVYFIFNPINPVLFWRAANRVVELGRKATKDADVVARHWLLIDVDPERKAGCSATNEEKARAWAKIVAIRDHLKGQDWPEPILADSGNGYHLLYRVDLPVDDGELVKRVLQALAADFDEDGVQVDTSVFNPARLSKLYGTKACKGEDTAERPHRWSRIIEAPNCPEPVPNELLEALAATAGQERGGPSRDGRHDKECKSDVATPVPTMHLCEKLKRARLYVAKMPPAIRGKGGDKQTYSVACRLVIDFDLKPQDALPLMLEYNQRCKPPWDESELLRKLEYAARLPGERGKLLRSGLLLQADERQPTPPPEFNPNRHDPFLGIIPDFMQWDIEQARPAAAMLSRDKGRRSNRPAVLSRDWILDIVRHAVVAQRCTLVLLPDVYLAQLRWGAEGWPANWRQSLARTLQSCYPDVLPVARDFVWTDANEEVPRIDLDGGWRRGEADCPPACPLHGRLDRPHRHFRLILPEASLGVMQHFAAQRLTAEQVEFDFRNAKLTREEVSARKKELKAELEQRQEVLDSWAGSPHLDVWEARAHIHRLKKELATLRAGNHRVPGAWSVYLPIRLFGPSPRCGLTPGQCNLLKALTLEITRTGIDNGRPDRAQLINTDFPTGNGKERPVPVPPSLDLGEYIAFNGTGRVRRHRCHGYGFKINTWLKKCGCDASSQYSLTLEHFHRLREAFGLVVTGWNYTHQEWKSLDEMLSLCSAGPGEAWLNGCVLRVYTRADYLARWRQFFAERLGFGSIPGGGQDGAVAAPAASEAPITTIRSANELQAWMQGQGLTDGQLAALLGVDRVTINHYRHGRRRWRAAFQAKLDAYLAGKA